MRRFLPGTADGVDPGTSRGHGRLMAGTITVDVLSDGSKRYRSRYRDAGGRQHEKRFKRRVDAQRWLDEQTSAIRSEEHTSELQSRQYLVCRLLLEKKKKK